MLTKSMPNCIFPLQIFLILTVPFLFFQGSTKCRARVITRMFADGEKVINRSFIHNHTPKSGLLQTGLQQV